MATDKPTKAEEVSLANMDKLLAKEDPGFAQKLEEVRQVEIDKDVVLEPEVSAESLEKVAADKSKPPGRLKRLWMRLVLVFKSRLKRFKEVLIAFFKATLIFLKTRPKEFALYSISLIRALGKACLIPFVAFRNATRYQKALALVFLAVVSATGWTFYANLKGIWLPYMTEPILHSLEPYADKVTNYDKGEDTESFYAAFPQERHEYLLPKIKVNLRRTQDNPNPMGAFELVILVDSRDAAIEVRDREVEFFDLTQRVLETESFVDLATDLGKSKFKARMRNEMNKIMSQGWVKEINFKTFILKP